jgi:hypothetical protein
VERGRSVLVRLDTPDLLFWNEEKQFGELLPSALIFNFTISHDQRHLLLQGESFLPLPNPYVPPRISAPQTSESQTRFEHNRVFKYSSAPQFDIDYERSVHPRDDPSITHYGYKPSVTLNVLGAGIAGYDTLLASEDQRYIEITLKDENSPTTNPPHHKFIIEAVKIWDRDDDTPHVRPEDLRRCGRWSWRCEDFGDIPWYRYIYRQDFDEFGKIGSLRHEFHQRLANLYNNLGVFRFWTLILAIGSMAVSPLVYVVYRKAVYINKKYVAIRAAYTERERIRRECEDDMLLDVEDGIWDYIDAPRYKEREEKLPEKEISQGEASVAVMEKPLPPVPAAEASRKSENM